MTDEKSTLEKFEKIAKKHLEDTLEHRPQIITFKEDNKIEIAILSFENDDEKNKMLEVMRKKIEIEKVKKYIIIMEAWVSQNVNVRPRDDEKRKEMLSLLEFNRDDPSSVKHIMNFFHKEDGKIVWGERSYTNSKDAKTSWNFYLEDVMDDKIEKLRLEKFYEIISKKELKENITMIANQTGKSYDEVLEYIEGMVKQGKVVPK